MKLFYICLVFIIGCKSDKTAEPPLFSDPTLLEKIGGNRRTLEISGGKIRATLVDSLYLGSLKSTIYSIISDITIDTLKLLVDNEGRDFIFTDVYHDYFNKRSADSLQLILLDSDLRNDFLSTVNFSVLNIQNYINCSKALHGKTFSMDILDTILQFTNQGFIRYYSPNAIFNTMAPMASRIDPTNSTLILEKMKSLTRKVELENTLIYLGKDGFYVFELYSSLLNDMLDSLNQSGYSSRIRYNYIMDGNRFILKCSYISLY